MRRLEQVHSQGITSVAMMKDGFHVATASYDGLLRWERLALCPAALSFNCSCEDQPRLLCTEFMA